MGERYEEDGRCKTKFFGFLLQLLTEDGEDRIRNNAEEWQIIEDTCDPLLLWKAIVTTHSLRTTDMSLVETRRSARVAYQRCIQLGGESLLNFKNRFKQCVDVLDAVGETKPTEDVLAVDFMEGLDKRLYGDMMNDLKNRVRNGEAQFPDSLLSAHKYAKNYSPPYAQKSGINNKSVYHTADDNATDEPSC
jgi:hypothetical protein